MRALILLSFLLLLGACATLPANSWEERDLERLASPELQTFDDQADFEEYLAQTRSVIQRRREVLRRRFGGDRIVVTGSRITNPPSITNNQNASVDEGDVVKRIGDYLLILQDGRVFVANFRTMERTDRFDLYARNSDGEAIGGAWYDEALVHGDIVIVSTYSYERDSSEFRVLRLDQSSGMLSDRGTFGVQSYDYYSTSNYTSRMIDGKLQFYLPLSYGYFRNDTDLPVMTYLQSGAVPGTAEREALRIEAGDVYRPVFAVPDVHLHLLISCDIEALANQEADCVVRGVIGGEQRELYVDTDAAYLVTSQYDWDWFSRFLREEDTCDVQNRRAVRDVYESAIFRIPHDGSEVSVAPLRSMPADQFGLDGSEGRMRVLVQLPEGCSPEDLDDEETPVVDVALVDFPMRRFSNVYTPLRENQIRALPSATGVNLQNRFVGDTLVYGARETWDGRPHRYGGELESDQAVHVVSIADTNRHAMLPLGHQIRRLERLRDGIVATGYNGNVDYHISTIALNQTPRLVSQIVLPDRYESENRSHSFNYRVESDGGGIAGLPTVGVGDGSEDVPYWREEPADMTFFRFEADGTLRPFTTVENAPDFGQVVWDEEGDGEWMRYSNGYSCEVSCIDWYGNARPIFIDDAVYTLMGTELVEAQATDTDIQIERRLDLTAEPSVDTGQ